MKRVHLVLGLPALLLCGLLLVFPALHALGYSLHGWNLDGYRFALQDRGFSFSLVITLLWTGANTLSVLWLGLHGAVFALEHPRWSRPLFFLLFLPWVIPVYIAAPLARGVLYGGGGTSLAAWLTGFDIPFTTNASAGFTAALVVSLWLRLPAVLFIIYGSLKKISRDLVEASHVDGCTRYHRIREIYLPGTASALRAGGFLTALSGFTEFSLLFLLTGGGPPMVSGITDRYIIGATTTVGVFLYRVFQGIYDYRVTASVGTLTVFGVVVLLMLWNASSREGEQRRRMLLMITAVVHMVSFGSWVQIFAVGFLVSLRFPKLFLPLVVLETAVLGYVVYLSGVLAGLAPAALISLAAGILLSDHPPLLARWHHAAVGLMAVVLASLSALLMLMLLRLTISGAGIISVQTLLPAYPSLEAYRRVLTDIQVWRSIGNSLTIALGSSLLLLMVLLPAYTLAALVSRKSRQRAVAIAHTVQSSGGIHTLIPLFFLFTPLALIDTRMSVMLVCAAGAVAPALMISSSYLEGHPDSLREAAELEGAGLIQWARWILLPLSIPVLAVSAVLAFLRGYNTFLVPLLMLQREELYPVSLRIYQFAGDPSGAQADWSGFGVLALVHLVTASAVMWKVSRYFGHTALGDH